MSYTPGIYPSVTEILKPWSGFENVPPEVLELAGERGTAVHGVCAAEALGLFFEEDEVTAPFLKSFRLWLPCFEVVKVEFELIDPVYKYMGHPDLMGRFIGDKHLSIIDYKTPVAYSPIWRCQLAAYRQAARRAGYDVERVASLRLSREGKPPILNESTLTVDIDFQGFYHALKAHQFFSAIKRKEF